MKRILGKGALVAVAAMLAALLSAPPASAQQYYEYKNVETRNCLDDSDRFGLRMIGCNGESFQSWTGGPDGTLFKNLNTGRCVTSSSSGVFPYASACQGSTGSRFQRWHEYYDENRQRHFQNEATTGCLDDSILGLRDIGCNETRFQSWLRNV
jgi:hypothetical protein